MDKISLDFINILKSSMNSSMSSNEFREFVKDTINKMQQLKEKKKSRKYSKKENEILKKVCSKLEVNGLNPFDTLTGVYLLIVVEALRKGFVLDLDYYHYTLEMAREALSRKANSLLPNVIESIIN